MGHCLVDQVDPKSLRRVEGLIRKQDTHGVGVRYLSRQICRTRPAADPSLAQQRKLESCVLFAGDPYVGRGQHDVEASSGSPAVDRADDGFHDLRVVVAQTAIGPDASAVHRARQRPKQSLGPHSIAILLRDSRSRREIVPRAEMAVPSPRQDDHANVSVFPDLVPRLGDFENLDAGERRFHIFDSPLDRRPHTLAEPCRSVDGTLDAG